MDRFRRQILSDVFEVCAFLREVMIARSEFHRKGLLQTPPRPNESHLGCEDCLMRILVELNHELTVLKKRAVSSGIEEREVESILEFWKLK